MLNSFLRDHNCVAAKKRKRNNNDTRREAGGVCRTLTAVANARTQIIQAHHL